MSMKAKQIPAPTAVDIENVLSRLRKGNSFPEWDRYAKGDMSDGVYCAVAVDAGGVGHQPGAAANLTDALAMAWIYACTEGIEKPHWFDVPLVVPDGWTFELIGPPVPARTGQH